MENPNSSNSDELDQIEFETPPSLDISFERPLSRKWEAWVETLRANPGQWAKLPSTNLARDRRALNKVAGIETLTESGSLYARYLSSPQVAELPSVSPTYVANKRTKAIVPEAPSGMGHLLSPVTKPLDESGIDSLLDSASGPIIGE